MTDYERGYRAGVEAAAKMMEERASKLRGIGNIRWFMDQAADIRALAPSSAPRSDAPPATPARMDAPGGPVCWCGAPSTYESGWCGTMHAKPSAPPATPAWTMQGCPECRGTGKEGTGTPSGEGGEDFRECFRCQGSGFVPFPSAPPATECPRCGGSGLVLDATVNPVPCPECGGSK